MGRATLYSRKVLSSPVSFLLTYTMSHFSLMRGKGRREGMVSGKWVGEGGRSGWWCVGGGGEKWVVVCGSGRGGVSRWCVGVVGSRENNREGTAASDSQWNNVVRGRSGGDGEGKEEEEVVEERRKRWKGKEMEVEEERR
ncbi:hypothetical protein Pcinc_038182 [Petrolisthes cinctipes]|uniref:Uncharacterized protein n=1 Tax=Petrolisthes cinctipes TaxID=88211 RepID=A0AAE1BR89_PETCI|nr:hypothetical protein Pcinc_038182 [Petrolisthes cinctipes]